MGWALVAHACNPSYSGGRDQEDHGLKPAWEIVRDPNFKKTHHKKTLVEWLKVWALSSNLSIAKKKKSFTMWPSIFISRNCI
jgi:hypothetical protein